MSNPHKRRSGLERVVFASRHSWAGLRTACREESAFRQELMLLGAGVPLALWLGRGWVETTLLIGTLVMVLIVELLNSGIEATVDRVSLEIHDLAKRAKDYGSAAVMLSLLLAGAVWLAVLVQRLHP
jgi:diacylglycerol kinase (ATP)